MDFDQPTPPGLPELIENEAQLNEVMTRPRPELVEMVKTLSDPVLVLGAGGKMGPTLAVLVRRALDAAGSRVRVIAVSRYSDPQARRFLEDRGVQTLALDLLERDSVRQLPEARDVLYLVGLKFGTSANPAMTWIMNTLVPAYIAERLLHSRIVALSTGNVYQLVPVTGSGSLEGDDLTPFGEYGNACVARERIFEYFSHSHQTQMAFMRLNYAVDLRYGVLVDIAKKVFHEQEIDLTNGYLNCIWQGDANEMIIRALSLARCPPRPLNLTYPYVFSVRELAVQMGKLLGKPPRFNGQEAGSTYLSNPAEIRRHLGAPATPIPTVMRWTAHWIEIDGHLLDKPTHFEVRDGKY